MKNTLHISSIIIFITLFSSCKPSVYEFKNEDVSKLKQVIIETEDLIKKIEILPDYKEEYATFYFLRNGEITLRYSTLNYNLKDSIEDGIYNSNVQKNVDTCKNMPGLTDEQWISLKNKLYELKKNGIKGSETSHCNDGQFLFFYYSYIYPDNNGGYLDTGHLAI